MNPKRFNLIYGYNGQKEEEGPYSLSDALEFLGGDDVIILQHIKVGESYVDIDGDTWERIE